jgi:type VI secretion system lysozyme-like protein
MSQSRLLKRLASWQQAKTANDNPLNIQELILVDVECLLNSQQGNVLIDEDMGLSDLQSNFNSHSAPDLETLATQITAQITRYEPRLINPQLTLNEDNKNLSSFSWRMACKTNSNLDVIALINVNADGRVSIKSAI